MKNWYLTSYVGEGPGDEEEDEPVEDDPSQPQG